jgi:hypothetical protein
MFQGMAAISAKRGAVGLDIVAVRATHDQGFEVLLGGWMKDSAGVIMT